MSLFNRPAWAKSQTATEGADELDTNIFSHTQRAYRDIVAEQERRKQAKLERKKVKEERRSSGKREKVADYDRDASPKRRRISQPEDDEDEIQFDTLDNRFDETYESNLQNPTRDQEEPTRLRKSPRHDKRADLIDGGLKKKHHTRTTVVDLGASDEEEVEAPSNPAPVVEIAEEDSDDEFAALARRARAQRQQKEEILNKNSNTSETLPNSTSSGTGALDTGQGRASTPPPDPTIQLFISSALEGTQPLIVHRKLSQNVGEIRKVWCQRQGFSEEAMKDIFFIHRMRRVYDVTTCRSLGLEVDALGNLTVKGAEGKEDADKIHLEAVTEESFLQMKAQKAQEAQRRENGHAGEAGTGNEHDELEQQPQETFIRVTLKAKDKQDFRLKVKPVSHHVLGVAYLLHD